MRERLFEPAAFEAFCEGFASEMEARRREHVAQMAGARRERSAVERRQREILNALPIGGVESRTGDTGRKEDRAN